MKIETRLHDPVIAAKKVGDGFSLFRRTGDQTLLGSCARLAATYPGLAVESNINGRNRLALHLLFSGDVQKNARLSDIDLPKALRTIQTQVPSIDTNTKVEFETVRIREDMRSNHTQSYLEAVIAEQTMEKLDQDSKAIKKALESLAPHCSSEAFKWRLPTDSLTIATLPEGTPPGVLDMVLETAQKEFPTPFTATFTAAHCTISGLSRNLS
jgi:hypothetical protein